MQHTTVRNAPLPIANAKQQELILKGLREGIYANVEEAKRNFSDWLDVRSAARSFLDNVDPNTI